MQKRRYHTAKQIVHRLCMESSQYGNSPKTTVHRQLELLAQTSLSNSTTIKTNDRYVCTLIDIQETSAFASHSTIPSNKAINSKTTYAHQLEWMIRNPIQVHIRWNAFTLIAPRLTPQKWLNSYSPNQLETARNKSWGLQNLTCAFANWL